jgi:hypothetical protein
MKLVQIPAKAFVLFLSCVGFLSSAKALDLPTVEDVPATVAGAEKLVVLIHGWQPDGPGDPYPSAEPMGILKSNLQTVTSQLSDWKFWAYEWDTDAATGGRNEPIDHPGAASVNALYHGRELAHVINETCPNLREVHFIAHSAGAWCGRWAVKSLLNKNPYMVAQLTLLDPFIPGVVLDPGAPAEWAPLTVDVMQDLSPSVYLGQIHRFENYYVEDFTDALWDATSQTFSTFSYLQSQNLNFDVGPWDYSGHSGPVSAYADTVSPQTPFDPDFASFESGLLQTGTLRPRFQRAPSATFGGGSAQLSVSVTSSQTPVISWYKKGSSTAIGFGTTISVDLTPENAGYYVAKATNSDGASFSDALYLDSSVQGGPEISSVAPSVLLTSFARQNLTINGANFTPSTTLRFHWSGQDFQSLNAHLSYISPTEIRYNILVEDAAGAWTVVAIDNGVESAPFAFTVVPAGGGRQLLSLSITGQNSVFENDSISLSATAFYSDGTSSTLPSRPDLWTENSPFATISDAGLFSAGEVSSDQQATVTASYTEGGITATATHEVEILNSTGGGGDTVELIDNGDFADDDDRWTTSGSFYADDRFTNHRSDPGYAYLSQANGLPGNNLNGEIAQWIDIPEGATNVTLTFYYHITTEETGSTAYDFLGVNIIPDSGGGNLSRTYSNLDANSGYQQASMNLSAFAGERVLVGFAGSTDQSLPTVFRIDDVSVEATVLPALTGLSITGPSSVLEDSSAQYEAVAFFADGSEQVIDADDWDEDSSYASISNNGLLSTEEVTRNRSVGIDAEYTQNGVTKTAFKRVTIVNIQPAFTGLAITGPTSVNERNVAQYEAEALYSDGTSVTVDPTWSVVSEFASISVGGSLGVGEVRSNQVVTVEASFTEEGVPQTASLDVTVIDISNPRIPVSLTISGPSTVDEGGIAQLVATVHYDDTTSIEIDPTWTENSSSATISAAGTLSAGSVPADTLVSISASYTENSTTVTANHWVTIINDTAAILAFDQPGVTHSIIENGLITDDVVMLSNRDSSTVSFTAFVRESPAWVTVSPASGSVGSTEVPLTLTFSVETLGVGIHTANLVVTPVGTGAASTLLPITVFIDSDRSSDPYLAHSTTNTGIGQYSIDASCIGENGDMFLIGEFTGTTTVAGQELVSNGSEPDLFAVLLDPTGNPRWVQHYGGPAEEGVDSCTAHPDGGWVICGAFEETGVFGAHSIVAAGDDGKRDAYLARIDANGQVLWARRAGGAKVDYGVDVAVDVSGNCILGGEFTENCTFDGGSTTLTAVGDRFDLFVVKYSSTGAFVWAVGAGGPDYDPFSSIATDQNENVYFSGRFTDSASFGGISVAVEGDRNRDAFIAKLNPSGSFQWVRRFGEPSGESSSEDVVFLVPSSADGLFFGGYYDGPWTLPDATLPDQEGGFVGHIGSDGAVIWIDAVHADHWADLMDFDDAVPTSDGGVIAIGRYRGNVQFGPSSVEQLFEDTNEYGILAKFGSGGTRDWATFLTGTNKVNIRNVIEGPNGTLHLWIDSSGTIELPGLGSVTPQAGETMLVTFGSSTPAFAPLVETLGIMGDALLLRFFAWPGATYRVECSFDLQSWATVESGIAPEIGWILFEGENPSITEKAFFYRLVIDQ